MKLNFCRLLVKCSVGDGNRKLESKVRIAILCDFLTRLIKLMELAKFNDFNLLEL